MAKYTVADAATKLGVSKEAIHNRIRRGSLESVIENGIKLVIMGVNTFSKTSTRTKTNTTKKSTPHVDDRYYKLLEEQNAKLQQKVETLEGETRSLRDQKEMMLIEERKKIEQIYKEKDEQLKNILNAISSKFMLNAPKSDIQEVEDIVEAEVHEEEIEKKESRLISLNKHIKNQNFSKKKAQKIKDKFKKRANDDKRIITIGKKIYIDLIKYDYSDLSL